MTVLFGRTATGLVVPVLVTADGEIVIEGSSVMSHVLLDGSVHPDTVANTPVEGDIIVGIDQGASGIKWDVLPRGTDGQVLTVQADGSLAWETPSGGGDVVLIQDQVLGAGAASIDFSFIPATYKHLRLVLSLRTNVAATTDNWLLRMNNDSGANYDWSYWVIYHNAQFATAEGLAGTYANMGNSPGNTATASMFSQHVIEIVDYLSTSKNKHANVQTTFQFGTTTGLIRAQAGGATWKSTAAINRLTILPLTGTQFVTNCRASLYGVK